MDASILPDAGLPAASFRLAESGLIHAATATCWFPPIGLSEAGRFLSQERDRNPSLPGTVSFEEEQSAAARSLESNRCKVLCNTKYSSECS